MNRRSHLLPFAFLVSCLALSACGSQSGAPPTVLVITPDPSLTAQPFPAFHAPCHLASPHGKTMTALDFSGPCSLTITGPVRCLSQKDDFYVFIHRTLHGWSFDVSINVEFYKGPGSYPHDTNVYVQFSKGQTIDAWGTYRAPATVTPGEHSLVLPAVTLPGYAGVVRTAPELIRGTALCR